METINNKIRRAINGDEDALEYIENHYLYIADKFYEQNKDKISKKELYLIVKEVINKFCNIETNIPLILHIYKAIITELNNRKEPNVEVKKAISLACQGDISARNELINHYSYLVIEKAKNYDYMDYEDLVQFGMIKLIEMIDKLISEHRNKQFPTTGIGRSIDIYFSRTLKKEVELWNTPLRYMENELDNFIFENDFISAVDSITTNETRREIIKRYFLEERTLENIGNNFDMSDENVRKIILALKPSIKRIYLKR